MAVLLNTKARGSSPKHYKAMYGSTAHGSSITPAYGTNTTWGRSLNVNGSGDISDGGWRIKTDVGKTYEMICFMGTTSGFYPPGRLLKGFTFSHAQTSTASRAVWLKRYGAMSSADKLWSSGTLSKFNDYNYHSRTATFDSSFMSHLNSSSRYIKYIAFQFSTEGGSTSRVTEAVIKDFKFTWVDVPSGKDALILPKLRSFSQRSDINAIA
jgi:hypothetical protein